jgi:DNA recombination protein RmuC
MNSSMVFLLVAFLAVIAALQLTLLLRRHPTEPADTTALQGRFDTIDRGMERIERVVRDEISASRNESLEAAQHQRGELLEGLSRTQDSLRGEVATLGQAQTSHLDSLVAQVGALRQGNEEHLRAVAATLDGRLESLQQATMARLDTTRTETTEHARLAREELRASMTSLGAALQAAVEQASTNQKQQLADFSGQLARLIESNERKLTEVQVTLNARLDKLAGSVEEKLQMMRADNESRLEQMRATVEEKLQGTLEARLGESFRTVSAQLEQVHKGLGEMQVLAAGVGDLKRVLSNVRARGTFGEVQLEALLEQVFSPDQFERNVSTKRGSAERVEFAIKLPGREHDESTRVLLPIDAKFPIETYQ